ncbi:PhosphoLipase D [Phytophthora megakarya]|uniref:PhosphoLipase D n=1 Tax=Phytophthora megakarya TaxID=4795 RepID=A0A225V3H0_9STRA|nr:PhosphoLipase D [Phytophthora megakarya]
MLNRMITASFVVSLAVSTVPASAFSFKSLFDQSATSQDSTNATLSGGSEITPQQLILDAEKWFLTEITAVDLWYMYMSYNIKARNAINRTPSSINGVKAIYIFDDRVRLVSSQHQRNMVILPNSPSDSGIQPVAYVGGSDRVNDRWDTIYHNNTIIRDAGHITYQQKGWVDGHIGIHEPAANDLANNFLGRWNSK